MALWFFWIWLVSWHAHGDGLSFLQGNSTDFALTGQFGDSFGGFSALMSALAVLGVVLSLYHSEESGKVQDFDRSFFTLLGHFQTIVASIDIHLGSEVTPYSDVEAPVKFAKGRDAIRMMLSFLRYEFKAEYYSNSKAVHATYSRFYPRWDDDLGHYFRLLYHIIRLIDERGGPDKTHYSRILRAHLSQSELTLLAYNCIVGEGREKFALYVERYSLLHNLARPSDVFGQAERRFFERSLAPEAFRQTPPLPFTY